ncbi:MAG: hypothetical protein ACLT46_17575 [Hungatella sp.]
MTTIPNSCLGNQLFPGYCAVPANIRRYGLSHPASCCSCHIRIDFIICNKLTNQAHTSFQTDILSTEYLAHPVFPKTSSLCDNENGARTIRIMCSDKTAIFIQASKTLADPTAQRAILFFETIPEYQ